MSEQNIERTEDKAEWCDVILLVGFFACVVSQAVRGNVEAALIIACGAFAFASSADWSRRWQRLAREAVEQSTRATMTSLLVQAAFDGLQAKIKHNGNEAA